MSIRVGLDLRPTEEGFKAHFGRGTGRYAAELSRELLTGDYSGIEIIPFFRKHTQAGKLSNFILQKSPIGKVTFETQFVLPGAIDNLQIDLFHFFSHGDAPARSNVPYLVSVLDLIPLRFPELYRANKPSWRYHFARFLEHQSIKKATGFIAISEATKRDLIEFFQIEKERIIVTPLAVGGDFKNRDLSVDSWELDMVSQRAHFKLPLDHPILLYVGGIDPRKNVSFLLEVFSEVYEKCTLPKKPLLVLAGPYESDQHYSELVSEIKKRGLLEKVVMLGFVPEQLLRKLYQAANMFLFPSLYEGFGLPVLEALACGVPVICGDNSSLPEVAGGSALLLKDNDKEEWVKEVLSLLSSPERQHQLSIQGVAQAKKFSWKNTASKTLEAYIYFLEQMGKKVSDREVERIALP